MNCLKHQRSARRGYTLMEMLMVQGVLVAVLAMSWPAMRGALEKNRLLSAARQIRAELAEARLKAIETGTTQQFRYVPGGNRCEVVDGFFSGSSDQDFTNGYSDDGDSFESSDVDDIAADRSPLQEQTHVISLDEDVHFADPRHRASDELIVADEEAFPAEEPEGETSYDDVTWSSPIVFYPNGRTSNARIRLNGPGELYVDVALRGLTGTATVGDLQRSEEPE